MVKSFIQLLVETFYLKYKKKNEDKKKIRWKYFIAYKV